MSENREAASAAVYQAIPHVAGNIASGRAELDILLHKTIHVVNCFVQKKNVPCCRRRFVFHRVKRSV
jgi:hypothetical protein